MKIGKSMGVLQEKTVQPVALLLYDCLELGKNIVLEIPLILKKSK
jgi:hypothetical protein